MPYSPVEQVYRERTLDRIGQESGEEVFRESWGKGRALSLGEAVAYALGVQ
jgi:hypothetical protein